MEKPSMPVPRSSGNWLEPLIAYGLASVFTAAAVTKLINFTDFLRVVRGFELFPSPLVAPLSALLISLEITLAAALVLPSTRRYGAFGSALTLIFFLFFVGYALTRGLVVDCGCFIFLQNRTIGLGLLVQDLLLAACALALAWRTGGGRAASLDLSRSRRTPT